VEIGTECRAGYHFAAFNLADSITVGVAMLVIDGLFGGAEAGKKASNEEVVMRPNAWTGLAAIGAVLALAGCSNGTRQPLGMTQGAPDESQTVGHIPLTVPPDYNVRPPAQGAPAPQEGTAAEPAQTPPSANNGGTAPATGDNASGTAPATGDTGSGTAAATGDNASGTAPATGDTGSEPAQSAGEVALLQNAGAAGIDPGIRTQIDTDTAARVERDQTLISRLVLWGTAEPEGQTPIITTRK
jgi:hypothetical protein